MRAYLSAFASVALCLTGLASPSGALAQSTGSSTRALDLEALKAELREELKEEVKAELKSELGGTQVTTDAGADAWESQWEVSTEPELNFLEFDGYFRMRYALFKSLDLGTFYTNPLLGRSWGPFAAPRVPPTPLCNLDVGSRGAEGVDPAVSCANALGDTDSIGGANMRFRLEPVLNVYEGIKIKSQVDILDNVVLGSTPDGFPRNPMVPVLFLSDTQTPPSDTVNALVDSVRVKRAWGEVETPFGQLRFGRMPAHFGMGLLANEGRGIDSNYGDTVDRLMFATKFGDYYIIPAFDWAVSGPTSAVRDIPYGQPFDRDQRDDVDQYVLTVMKKDSDREIKEKLDNDQLVLNYGTYQVLRFQALDAANYYEAGDPNRQASDQVFVQRDSQAWIYSLWVKLLWRKLSLEAEYVGVVGKIGNDVLSGGFAARGHDVRLNQHGGALNAEYKLLRDSLTLSLLVVAASGDPAPGWGVFPFATGGEPGAWEGNQSIEGSRKLTNFRVDPDFAVDLIFWRQLVGLVTDALVIRPGVQYNFVEGIGARLDLVYSRAWYASSTPSGSLPRASDHSANLGLEADAKLFFQLPAGFTAWLQYGLFIPFGGLDRQIERDVAVAGAQEGEDPNRLNAGLAQTIQAMLAITF